MTIKKSWSSPRACVVKCANPPVALFGILMGCGAQPFARQAPSVGVQASACSCSHGVVVCHLLSSIIYHRFTSCVPWDNVPSGKSLSTQLKQILPDSAKLDSLWEKILFFYF
jgi:hypothetical protein